MKWLPTDFHGGAIVGDVVFLLKLRDLGRQGLGGRRWGLKRGDVAHGLARIDG